MRCEEVKLLIDQYWEMTEDDPARIELEAHLFDCDQCASLLALDQSSITFNDLTSIMSEDRNQAYQEMSKQVMDRIYEEESWFMPISSKTYHFSKNFRKKIAMIFASCLAMFSIALFLFIFDYNEGSEPIATSKVSGVVDIANAASDDFIDAVIYSSQIPVASLSDPIVMQVIPTFPQYYVALSLVGIILTLLLLNWFARTRN